MKKQPMGMGFWIWLFIFLFGGAEISLHLLARMGLYSMNSQGIFWDYGLPVCYMLLAGWNLKRHLQKRRQQVMEEQKNSRKVKNKGKKKSKKKK